MGLFEKKFCSVCGEKIGLLGNRKLEDGNLCKDCANKLSPWFDERRHSTVAEIEEQLRYREENKKEVEKFNPTRVLGRNGKIYLDEGQKKFILTHMDNWRDSNPDVLDYSQITGCQKNISEYKTEEKQKDKEGHLVSYNPPKYTYSRIRQRHKAGSPRECHQEGSGPRRCASRRGLSQIRERTGRTG